MAQTTLKLLFPLCLILFSTASFGQIPEFESNVNELEKSESYLFNEFHTNFQFIIGYTTDSFWNKKHQYKILAFDGLDWKFIKWTYELNKKEKLKKSKQKSTPIEKEHAQEFLSFIKSKGFYNFNQDSLNWNKKYIGNDSYHVKVIYDGVSEKFEIISPKGHRISSSREPIQLQEFVYNEQRKNFLESLNKFLELSESTAN